MAGLFAVSAAPLLSGGIPDGTLFISPGFGLLIVLGAIALVGGLLRYLNGPMSRPCSEQQPPRFSATRGSKGDSKRRDRYRAAA